jgi:DDE superfamily endonuclease
VDITARTYDFILGPILAGILIVLFVLLYFCTFARRSFLAEMLTRLYFCTFGIGFPSDPHEHTIDHAFDTKNATAPRLHPPNNQSTIMSVSSFGDISEDSSLLSSTDSDEELENVVKKVATLPFFYLLLIRRRSYLRSLRWSPPRLIWSDYVAELTHQNEFNVTFRMSLSSFNKLVDLLRPALSVDDLQSCRASSGRGPVMPELIAAMSLRWLAGGQWQDIKKVYGVSRTHFYFLRRKFMNAVMACPVLEIKLPDVSDIDALKKLASQFEANASRPVFRGCVGALDGLTVLIKAPSASEAENVLSYYSGHYKHDSLNVQAMSNHCGKFLYFAVAAPGSFPHAKALALTQLKKWIDALPHGYYVLADNAYVISEHLLIPFSGSQQNVPQNSCYNYFLSQLRIRIEQAFGQFSVKWRIIHKPLETSLATSSLILITCARLHNFIIDNDWQCNEDVTRSDVVGTLSEIFRPSLSRFENQPGASFLRDMIVSYVEENGYRRPSYNRLRNERVNFEEYERQFRLM